MGTNAAPAQGGGKRGGGGGLAGRLLDRCALQDPPGEGPAACGAHMALPEQPACIKQALSPRACCWASAVTHPTCTLPATPHWLMQAASLSALGVAEGRGHVVQSSTPVHPFAVGGAGMQPAAAYLSTQVAAAGVRRPGDTLPPPPPDILPHPSGATVSDLTRPEHQFQPWRPDLEARLRALEGMGGGSLHAMAPLGASGSQVCCFTTCHYNMSLQHGVMVIS